MANCIICDHQLSYTNALLMAQHNNELLLVNFFFEILNRYMKNIGFLCCLPFDFNNVNKYKIN